MEPQVGKLLKCQLKHKVGKDPIHPGKSQNWDVHFPLLPFAFWTLTFDFPQLAARVTRKNQQMVARPQWMMPIAGEIRAIHITGISVDQGVSISRQYRTD